MAYMHQVKIEFVLALRAEQNHKTATILTHGLAHGSCKTTSTHKNAVRAGTARINTEEVKQWIELWSQMRKQYAGMKSQNNICVSRSLILHIHGMRVEGGPL